jgi:hypothetical protein
LPLLDHPGPPPGGGPVRGDHPCMVGLLDLTDHTLHLAGEVHLVTRCGVPLQSVTAGPLDALEHRAARRCLECWP